MLNLHQYKGNDEIPDTVQYAGIFGFLSPRICQKALEHLPDENVNRDIYHVCAGLEANPFFDTSFCETYNADFHKLKKQKKTN
jgi:hypothetical protein